MVLILFSSIVCNTSSEPITPKIPSKRPPFGCESIWEPLITGARASFFPTRFPKIFPISSIRTSRSSRSSHLTKRSLACLSVSVKVRRSTPPAEVAPIFAIFSSLFLRRSPFILKPFVSRNLPPYIFYSFVQFIDLTYRPDRTGSSLCFD